MKSTTALILFAATLALFLAGCGAKDIPDGTVVSIIYSSDVRGKLEGCGCQNSGGGVARRSGEVVKAQEEDPSVVFCDAGNFMSGTPEVDKSKGAVAVEVYNQMKANVVNVSERELAFGMDAFNAAKKDAKFDFVSANLRHKGAMVAQPFTVKKVKEARVAFIGLCGSKDLMRYDSLTLPAEVSVEDPVAETRRAIVSLEKKADLIVVLSTCGDAMDSLLALNVPGIDLIIGGRTFRPNVTAPWVLGKTRVVRTPRDGRSMGRMDMVFGPDAKIKTYSATALNTTVSGPVDAKMVALVKKYIPNYSDAPAEQVSNAGTSAAK
ncbi:MAG TPA: hypothetical protein VGL38_04105 [bacterium]